MKRAAVAVAALASIMSGVAMAGPYASAGVGASTPAFTGNDQFGTGAQAVLGVEAAGVFLEGAYLNTGVMRDIDGGPKSRFTGGAARIGYRLGFGQPVHTTLGLKAGYYQGDSVISAREPPFPDRRNDVEGLTIGILAERRLTSWFAVHFGLDLLSQMPDFSDDGEELLGDGDADVLLFNIGATFRSGEPPG